MKSPSAMNELMAPTASICPGEVGRMTAHLGRFGLMNSHGTGKIRFVCSREFTVASKFGNVNWLVGSVSGASGGCAEFPEKSTHSRKWQISSPPILNVILRTSALVTFWLMVA